MEFNKSDLYDKESWVALETMKSGVRFARQRFQPAPSLRSTRKEVWKEGRKEFHYNFDRPPVITKSRAPRPRLQVLYLSSIETPTLYQTQQALDPITCCIIQYKVRLHSLFQPSACVRTTVADQHEHTTKKFTLLWLICTTVSNLDLSKKVCLPRSQT